MKRRTTLIQPLGAPFEPDQAVLSSSNLAIRGLDAARHDRITLGLDDLPEELRNVLESSHELHLRWAAEEHFDAIAPFSSRVSPGLHVHYTSLVSDRPSDTLCSVLRAVFGADEGDRNGVDCTSPEKSFTTPPLRSTRFATSTSLQYYTRLPSLQTLVGFIRRTICHQRQGGAKCHDHADTLLTADSVDIDYDSTSHTLAISGFWSSAPTGGWSEDIGKLAADDKIEIGLLGVEPGASPDELKAGGLLGSIGEDKKLTSHSPSQQGFIRRCQSPSRTLLYNHPPAPKDFTCALHTYLTLPSSVFIDQYQVGTDDPLFLQEHNLVAVRAFSGETDLEAPDWAIDRWGSTWLLELATPSADSADPASNWTSTIPMHLRYLNPSESGYRSAAVPWPVVFWACSTEEEGEMGKNPFDRTNLGYDGLFGPRTIFYQLHPASQHLVEELDVPVLKLKDGEGLFQARNIELGTSVVIILGFLWIIWRLARVVWATGLGANEVKRPETHEKKE
ncbi:hypothetical protein N7509_011846 [Penicillium cosmopolitanum]|uniref:Protein PBN1 n=1 Tax=Penicillium cosmopolitanum TaxID=1131564 RepID=A0A9W9SHJ4_9EURO|nr:uncharacterized protein N7509_011846 [Penicillium cosmopolitanum]KAJ5378727.1 hypothetical protein N7509_011846 [Penicillium cosmopolitanum]